MLIISNNGLALYKQENRDIFLQEYSNWIEGIYSNSIGLTGHIVKLDWLPKHRLSDKE
ncbi:hypothetical protein GF378_00920 [Candidatus Pacearchaeota archaeon]|nr:hypothetical protein [Candidatus Pacearchaeota archaeon]